MMTKWDVEETYARCDAEITPNLVAAIELLARLITWTDRNSDGWVYWRKPGKAASKLTALIGDATPGYRNTPEVDISEADLRKAITPIKTFLTLHSKGSRVKESAAQLHALVIDPPPPPPPAPEVNVIVQYTCTFKGRELGVTFSSESALEEYIDAGVSASNSRDDYGSPMSRTITTTTTHWKEL